jgi:uncharacterized protein with von Willebrand factor type A (vWA) domain
MIATRHIGKESNDWERQAILGLNAYAQPVYGISESDRSRLIEILCELVAKVGKRKASSALSMTPVRLAAILAGTENPANAKLLQSLAARLPAAVQLFAKLDHDRRAELDRLREQVECDGLRATARRVGVDASNLRRKLATDRTNLFSG